MRRHVSYTRKHNVDLVDVACNLSNCGVVLNLTGHKKKKKKGHSRHDRHDRLARNHSWLRSHAADDEQE